jgi:predicted phosphoadenosine phosphosulfate sulfurtransferase
MLGAGVTEREIYEQICKVVDDINATVQTYKRISLTILRQDEFVKSSSRKIKRAGLADAVKDEYLARRG